MKRLNKFFEKFYKADKYARFKFCLKILKVLVKNYSLLIWFPDLDNSGKENGYYGRFRSEKGADFLITLRLVGDQSSDYMRYEFGVEIENDPDCILKLCHIINRVELGRFTRTGIMVIGRDLPIKVGYSIVELYNKVVNQTQTTAQIISKMKKIEERLDTFKKPQTV